MAQSLRDQLLQLGLAKGAKHVAKPTQAEIDLRKAYAERERREKAEAEAEARRREAEAVRKRELKNQIKQLLDGKALNAVAADLARNFEYGGKIRRVYVTAQQQQQINAGELAIVQHAGRYSIVPRVLAEAVAALEPRLVAVLIDDQGPEGGDDYADPRFAVPDDLHW